MRGQCQFSKALLPAKPRHGKRSTGLGEEQSANAFDSIPPRCEGNPHRVIGREE
jgi:hypothetical protein